MTEHLDGSYPTLKFRNKQARDNGQTNAHVNDMWPFGNYHIGRERLFIILQGFGSTTDQRLANHPGTASPRR